MKFRAAASMGILTVLFVIGNGRSEVEEATAQSPEKSLLCVSKCDSCPVVCSSPPPPPSKPSVNEVPSSPQEKKPFPPLPPPSSWIFSSSPSSSSFSYPYYYFYSSDALRSHGLLPTSLLSVPLLLGLISFVWG